MHDRELRALVRRLRLHRLHRRPLLLGLGLSPLLGVARRVLPFHCRLVRRGVLRCLALRQHAGLDRLALPELREAQRLGAVGGVLLGLDHRLAHRRHRLLVVIPHRRLPLLQIPCLPQQTCVDALRPLTGKQIPGPAHGGELVRGVLARDLRRQHLGLRRDHRRLRLVPRRRQDPQLRVVVHMHQRLPPRPHQHPRLGLGQPPAHAAARLLRRQPRRQLAQDARDHRQRARVAQRLLVVARLGGHVAQPRRGAPLLLGVAHGELGEAALERGPHLGRPVAPAGREDLRVLLARRHERPGKQSYRYLLRLRLRLRQHGERSSSNSP